MKLSFEQGVALVAGGSGGIGRKIVRQLAASGLPVALTYRSSKDVAERLVTELGGAPTIRAYPWGSSKFSDAAALAGTVREEMGRIRYLVVASGIAQEAAFHTLDEDAARRLVDVNLSSVIALTRSIVTPMLKAGSGRIVVLGSVSGSRGIKGHTVYAATKAALEGFTRALAQEAAGFGVTVNCVAPGFIETEMTRDTPEAARKKWIKRIPMGRLGAPDEAAALVGFLLSDQAAYITGQTLVVDGGISL